MPRVHLIRKKKNELRRTAGLRSKNAQIRMKILKYNARNTPMQQNTRRKPKKVEDKAQAEQHKLQITHHTSHIAQHTPHKEVCYYPPHCN
jgi:hypothetical protein